jgi:hypothetical protein
MQSDYEIKPVHNYAFSNSEKVLFMRHDVDRGLLKTQKMAELEAAAGIFTSYYFRGVSNVAKPDVIKKVRDLGHEIGYHYEELSICNGNYEKAYDLFRKNLDFIRQFYPVKTICMHGSPLSKWDNKLFWEKYTKSDFNISLDATTDIDYNITFYITDSGMGWNKGSVTVRDKVNSHFNIPIRNTTHLQSLLLSGELPNSILLNTHPTTFSSNTFYSITNRFVHKAKNIPKYIIVKSKIFE